MNQDSITPVGSPIYTEEEEEDCPITPISVRTKKCPEAPKVNRVRRVGVMEPSNITSLLGERPSDEVCRKDNEERMKSLDPFLESEFVKTGCGRVKFSEFVKNYTFWCKFNGFKPLNCSVSGPLVKELRKRGYYNTKVKYNRYCCHVYIQDIQLK